MPLASSVDRSIDPAWFDLQADHRLATSWDGWKQVGPGRLAMAGQPSIRMPDGVRVRRHINT